MTLVCDLEQATVEYIERDRKQASLQSYFDGFESEALEAGQAVSMEMCPPYINACLEKIPGAEGKIVFDRAGFQGIANRCDGKGVIRPAPHQPANPPGP